MCSKNILQCDKDIRVFLDQDLGEVAVSIEEEVSGCKILLTTAIISQLKTFTMEHKNGSLIALFSCQSDVTKLNVRLTTTENKPVMIEVCCSSVR